MHYLPSTVTRRHGSWFEYVRSEKDLGDDERRVLEFELALPFLRELETATYTTSFELVSLEALLDADALVTGMALPDLAAQSHAILRRSPELWKEVADADRFATLGAANNNAWHAYWDENPIAAWTTRRKDRRTWFNVQEGRFAFGPNVAPDLVDGFSKLVREIVDYKLAQYRARRAGTADVDGFVCKVMWNKRDPILNLPNRTQQRIPEGDTDVRLPDGSVWQFGFVTKYVNTARPAGAPRNQLPDLLRGWFGPRAGQPGTAFQVRFSQSPDGLWIDPVHANVITVERKRGVVTSNPRRMWFRLRVSSAGFVRKSSRLRAARWCLTAR